jgi:hypothetical protein
MATSQGFGLSMCPQSVDGYGSRQPGATLPVAGQSWRRRAMRREPWAAHVRCGSRVLVDLVDSVVFRLVAR